MRNNGSRNPEEILQEIERTRSDMDRTLGAIERRLTPGELMDQGLDYLRHSGGREFVSNLGGSVKNNPLPVALVGIGLAWLMSASRHGHDGAGRDYYGTGYGAGAHTSYDDMVDYSEGGQWTAGVPPAGQAHEHSAKDRAVDAARSLSDDLRARAGAATEGVHAAKAHASESLHSAKERASAGIHSARERTSDSLHAARDRASESLHAARDRVSAAAHSARERFGDTAHAARDGLHRAGASARHGMQRVHNGYDRMVREQPLALGAIGVAVGALLAAIAPRTRTEDEVMGETAERFKDEARRAGEEQVEKAKSVATAARDAATEEARRQLQGGQGEHDPSGNPAGPHGSPGRDQDRNRGLAKPSDSGRMEPSEGRDAGSGATPRAATSGGGAGGSRTDTSRSASNDPLGTSASPTSAGQGDPGRPGERREPTVNKAGGGTPPQAPTEPRPAAVPGKPRGT